MNRRTERPQATSVFVTLRIGTRAPNTRQSKSRRFLDPYRGACSLWVLLYSAESARNIPGEELDRVAGTSSLVELARVPIALEPIQLTIFGR